METLGKEQSCLNDDHQTQNAAADKLASCSRLAGVCGIYVFVRGPVDFLHGGNRTAKLCRTVNCSRSYAGVASRRKVPRTNEDDGE